MVDFSKQAAKATTPLLSDALSVLLDAEIAHAAKVEYERSRGSGEGDVAKKRVGAGYAGVECGRALAFKYHKFPVEDRGGKVNAGELNRHAQAGHWTEDKTAEWLRLVGFDLQTHRTNQNGTPKLDRFGKPEQIGWKAARDPETGQFRLAGEVDGIIHGAPAALQIPAPSIWESKKATDKKWNKFKKEGVAKADPKYFGQLQLNMAYLDIGHTLFSMLNLDNMKFHFELIAFDQRKAQAISDRALEVILSETPMQFPRLCRSEDDFTGKFCDYHDQCWGKISVVAPARTVVRAAPPPPLTSNTFNPDWLNLAGKPNGGN